jgi:anti-sigma regulatory factor (Ser/Thr protein kinase)
MPKIDLKKLILDLTERREGVKVSELIERTGFSRAYINRFLSELEEEGKIVLIGKTNKARYVKADKDFVLAAKKEILSIHKKVKNQNISEDTVLKQISQDTGIFIGLRKNIESILNYAFTEMLNNAIEHSRSEEIEIKFQKKDGLVKFEIVDFGIGIFKNIMQKRGLANELEAIQDLLKGKQTTAPQRHTGEGVFFTSKLADAFMISSSNKKLTYNNIVEDIFPQDIKFRTGTKVTFSLSENSKRDLNDVFKEYSGDNFDFDTTKVAVRLYKMGDIYISRSQAKRIMSGLDKFKTVILDFRHINAVGQGFADQIFRVWHNEYPGIDIQAVNSNENIDMMIGRAKGVDAGQKPFDF